MANLISCGCLSVGAVFRLMHCFTVKFNFFFLIVTLYYMSFIVILAAAEMKYMKPDHEKSKLIRTYFNFLDRIIGRGLFLIFLACILLQGENINIEWVLALVCIGTGVCDIILGWDEQKADLPQVPWKSANDSLSPAQAVPEPSEVQNAANSMRLKAAYAEAACDTVEAGRASAAKDTNFNQGGHPWESNQDPYAADPGQLEDHQFGDPQP